MYIIKNAFRCISRSKGRNILIGIIALVIAVSACIGLSIRQASESAKASALEGLVVTATIQYDRAAAMGNMGGGRPGAGGGGGFDRDQFAGMMGNASSLSLEEYEKYSEAESVQGFYYTLTAYFNGSDAFLPVSDETEESAEASTEGNGMPARPNGMGQGPASGDFTVVGYSSDSAMTAFVDGNASIVEGSMFEEGTSDAVCVISEEAAMYNSLAVGDSVTVTNPSLESESYSLTVVGIYTSAENNDFSMSMFGASQDPANQIYMSANALQSLLSASEANASDTKVSGNLSATYTFADADAYYAFEEEVRTLGLDDAYTVSSPDITAFENSIAPLHTLSTMAGWFLLVILVIGGIILVVLNIFNVRERKYEVGVLTAMGMKKWKVATQFVCEILAVTMLAVLIGAGIGAVSSVPVTNALLEGQIESQEKQQMQMDQSFGRPGNMGGGFLGGDVGERPEDIPNDAGGGKNPFGNMIGGTVDYITEVNSAMNLTVVLQMLCVGLLLTLVASAASVLFIMRYDPLKILANRD
ncbi:MAG: ABC transporter permease [Ruminococcaceae bacterium]|nr:ABC transporter permease [Oscillospiraceae bacterium]